MMRSDAILKTGVFDVDPLRSVKRSVPFPPDLRAMRRVHIVGVGGTLMAPFAVFLKKHGIEVTGSDQEVYPPMSDVLANAGVRVFKGYQSGNIICEGQRPDLVVIGNVVRPDNPEARAAIEGGLCFASLPEVMEHFLLKNTRNLVVAGTHGKTTTSSILAHVLIAAGQDPSYFIGGVVQGFDGSFKVTDASTFVLEGDEYDTAFWDKVPKFNHYLPDDVILTSIEFDHSDIYKNLEAVKSAFIGLVERIRPGGRLIACSDYPSVLEAARFAQVPVITYGIDIKSDFRVHSIEIQGDQTRFMISSHEGDVALETPLFGSYNALNVASVWIECKKLGLHSEEILKGLRSFKGVKRRQEVRGEIGGVLVIDDFGHHPTAIRETLLGFRDRFLGRRILAVFEPRSATSRRSFFQSEFATALALADLSYISTPYDVSSIPEDLRLSVGRLVADLRREGRPSWSFDEIDSGVKAVAEAARPSDIILVFSNGGFGGFIPKLLVKLRECV